MASRFSQFAEPKQQSRFSSFGESQQQRYVMPEEIADKFILSDKPIHQWYPAEQAEVSKSILDSLGNPDDIDAKSRNALYMESLFGISPSDAMVLHDQLAEAMFNKKDSPAIRILEDIKDHEIQRKTLKQTVVDGYNQAGIRMVDELTGLLKIDQESGKIG